MRKISKEELKKILENHKHWLKQNVEGWENMCADLRDMDLRGADLSGINLCGANLGRADLNNAYLDGTNLCRANLSGATLSGANLTEADLCEAKLFMAYLFNTNLYMADLRNADLSNAKLHRADLYAADLRGANLCNTSLLRSNLRGASLNEADLSGASLHGADLYNADLSGAKLYISRADLIGVNFRGANLSGAILSNQEYINSMLPICCPEEGSFIGWKKAFVTSISEETSIRFKMPLCKTPVIVKLLIPNTAKRLSATSRKCRCNEVEVLDIQSVEFGGPSIAETCQEAFSGYDPEFVYKIGETVRVEDFDEDRWNECSTGIHFFITRQEAVNYGL